MTADGRLVSTRFPRSSTYHPEWVMASSSGGANALWPDNAAEIQALEADRGRYLGYVRLVSRRRADARLDEPIVSIPTGTRRSPCYAT